MTGFDYWPSTWNWGIGTYLTGRGWISGSGSSSGNVEGSYINVSGSGRVTAGTNTGTTVTVAGYTTVSGTPSLAPSLRGMGSLNGYSSAWANNLSGTGWVSTSGSGTANLSGTANVNVISPSTLAADDKWSANVSGSGRVSGSGTTSGTVRGTFLMTGASTSGVGTGYSFGALYSYPKFSLSTGQADATGSTSVSTNYKGYTQVSGTVTSSAAGSKSGSGTVSGTPSLWTSGFGSVNLTGENVRIWI